MTDITELALIAKIKKQTENFDTVVLKEWEALALVESLEKAQETIAFQQGEIKALLSSLESRTVKLPLPSCTYADNSYPAYSRRQVISLLESLGITLVEGDV